MNENPTGPRHYFQWLSLLCLIMAAFCIGVFLIGYKSPSIGRVATLVLLLVGAFAFHRLSQRRTL